MFYWKWFMRLSIFCSFMVTLLPLTLSAQNTNNPRYKAAIQQAKTSKSKGDYKEAAEATRRALSLSKDKKLLFDIALLYEQAKSFREALKYYKAFIDRVPADGRVTDANTRIIALKAKLKGKYEQVMVTTQPPGAYIYVDDQANGAQGTSPLQIKLLPGSYMIIAELDGYVMNKQRLTLQEGAAAQVAITLHSENEVAPVTFLINRPGAQVYIDRALRGKSPITEPLLVRKGIHEIKIIKGGYQPWVRKVNVQAQRPLQVDAELVKSTNAQMGTLRHKRHNKNASSTIGPWITMGAGLLFLGGGTYTGVSAQTLYTQLEERRDQQLLIAPTDISSGSQFVMLTNLLIGIGAASLTAGGLWWYLDKPKTSRTRRRRAMGLDFGQEVMPYYGTSGAQ